MSESGGGGPGGGGGGGGPGGPGGEGWEVVARRGGSAREPAPAEHAQGDVVAARSRRGRGGAKKGAPPTLSPKEQYGHRYKTERALLRRKIFVGGIGPLGEKDISGFFGKHGDIESVEVLRGRDKQPRGFAFVIFRKAETVDKLVAVRFFEVGNRPVEVKACEPQPRASAGPYGGGARAPDPVSHRPSGARGQAARPADPGQGPHGAGAPATQAQPPRPAGHQQPAASVAQPHQRLDLQLQANSQLGVQQYPGRITQPTPPEVDAEANSLLKRVYAEQDTIQGLVQRLQALRRSQNARDVSLYEAVVTNLLDEYRFFSKYPDKELRITGNVFGNLIQYALLPSPELLCAQPAAILAYARPRRAVSARTSQNQCLFGCVCRRDTALQYLCDALRQPAGSKMFVFGVCALEQAQWRIPDFPQQCALILQLPSVAQASPSSVATIRGALAGQPPPQQQQQPPPSPPPPQQQQQQQIARQWQPHSTFAPTPIGSERMWDPQPAASPASQGAGDSQPGSAFGGLGPQPEPEPESQLRDLPGTTLGLWSTSGAGPW